MLLYPYSLHLSYVYKSKRYVHGEIMYITGFFEIFSQIRHFLNVTRYVYGHVMYITQGFFLDISALIITYMCAVMAGM